MNAKVVAQPFIIKFREFEEKDIFTDKKTDVIDNDTDNDTDSQENRIIKKEKTTEKSSGKSSGKTTEKSSGKTTEKSSGKSSGKGSGKSSGKSSEFLALIEQTPQITIPELSQLLKITTRMVEKKISKFKTQGLLERVNGRKSGYWKVNFKR